MQRIVRITQHLQPSAAGAVAASSQQHGPALLELASCSARGSPSDALRPYLRLSPEVAAALAAGTAVVALESTIISHGMPYPQNLETALRVEAACRAHGATPATIAILDGVIHVGLEQAQLSTLAQLGEKCHKCSRRDLALLVARKQHGATTVAATMIVAEMAGIDLFVTGGIGGVHRGVESSMDISADLSELARTPVAVVCAGVKSILDIAKTLEHLETSGVAVAAYGAANFPAFFTRDSGIVAPSRVDSAAEAAAMVYTSLELGLGSGSVIAVPVPQSQAAQGQLIEQATTQALSDAATKGIKGRDITPFLLARINKLTGGTSLASNIALILNNVAVGAEIAVQLARMKKEKKALLQQQQQQQSASASSSTSSASSVVAASAFPSLLTGPLVAGGCNLDLLGRPAPGTKFLLGTSNPGSLQRSWGGVGRNVAEVLGRLGARPHLLSAVGTDDTGSNLLKHAREAGVQTQAVLRSDRAATSTYMAILDERGDLFTTIADMALADAITPDLLPSTEVLRGAPLVVVDGNVSREFAMEACVRARASRVPTLFEPTSVEKCARAIQPILQGLVTFVTPSAAELLAMHQLVQQQQQQQQQSSGSMQQQQQQQQQQQPHDGFQSVSRDAFEHNESVLAVETQARSMLAAVASRAQAEGRPVAPLHIMVKRGAQGVMLASMLPAPAAAGASASSSAAPHVSVRFMPAGRLPSTLVNTSGAGDSCVGAFAWKLIQLGPQACSGQDLAAVARAVSYGMRAAEMTLCSPHSVSQDLSAKALEQRQKIVEREQQ